MKKILIVVDYQYDFASPQGNLSIPNAYIISSKIQEQINSNKYNSIIYTFDTHIKKEYKTSDEKTKFNFPLHCEYGKKGWKLYNIIPKNNEKFIKHFSKLKEPFTMISIENEFFFTKNVFDIWEGNKIFPEWFTNTFNKQAFEVEVVGVATNYCVFMNVMGLVKNGYKVSVLKDCVKGITNNTDGSIDKSYKENINIMKNNNVSFI